jgi:peptide chain release factor 1
VNRKPLFSVTKADLRMDTFTVPGPGGGGKDTSRTGVRFTHIASGAVGEGREERSQNSNKQAVFRKMAEHPKFKAWMKLEVAKRLNQPVIESPEQVMERVDRMIASGLQNGQIVVDEF